MGQEQDSLGGFFDPDQSFSGEMSQVEFWNMKLDDLTIKVARKKWVMYKAVHLRS